MPLAEKIRPKTFDEVVGQRHLLAPGAPLRRILESGHLPSMVFHGPSGTGKTTVADIIARQAGLFLVKLNATVASLSDVRAALDSSATLDGLGGVLLYIDEIQYFNKKQQQSLLEYVEDGRVTLICATTENPFYTLYGALLSRSTAFEFKAVERSEIVPALRRALEALCAETGVEKRAEDGALETMAAACGGDVRKAINTLENVYYASDDVLTVSLANELSQRSSLRFDRADDGHYELLSALQKSIRGSDVNAALYYLACLLEGGDLLSPCRRLLVMASEDIGLAYPMAAVIVKSCVDSAMQLGLPEAKIPLSHAAALLALSPKSNSANSAYNAAAADVFGGDEMPYYLQSGNEKDYKYPHSYPNSYVKQQYLPDRLKERRYYSYGDNKTERAMRAYWQTVKGSDEK